MADGLDLTEIVRRTVQANARFYKGWVDLSLEYFRGISEIFGVAEVPVAAEESDPGTDSGVLVLESEAGGEARGAFLVTNDLGRTMSCQLVASAFAEAGGSSVPVQPKFEPATLELAPGEQRVVQVAVTVDDRLSPGVAYTGEFSVKGMEGFAIPVVLRRRHQVDESPIDRELPGDVPGKGRTPAKGPAKARAAQPRKPAGKRPSSRKR